MSGSRLIYCVIVTSALLVAACSSGDAASNADSGIAREDGSAIATDGAVNAADGAADATADGTGDGSTPSIADASMDSGEDGGGDGCDLDGGGGCDSGRTEADAGPACSDGVVDPGEVCDDGNDESGDGCTANCRQVEANYICPTAGQPCVSTVECGDSRITGDETCDDGNTDVGDGCDADCRLEAGWVCPVVGLACEAKQCNDGIIAGNETCEDGNTDSGDGCDASCSLEDGYVCNQIGRACVRTVCGDGIAEGSERCDDQNNDLGDGCTPLCELEPDCSAGACSSPCGDSIKFADEECDDGNTLDGDGCSSSCLIEPGFTCTVITENEPSTLVIPMVIRDFDATHVDMEIDIEAGELIGSDQGIVRNRLGTAGDTTSGGASLDGKPVYADRACVKTEPPSPVNGWDKCTRTTFDQDSFHQWYRDVPGLNQVFVQTMTLTRTAANTYLFDSDIGLPDGSLVATDGFFPIDGLGYGNSGTECRSRRSHNFLFTSEVRYWFQYDASNPPTLSFSGDDDVFVFVNGHLAIDIGGVHEAVDDSFTLNTTEAANWGLSDGKIYEVAVFQAERNTCASNYKLTLNNFLVSRSECQSLCGDGIVTRDEVCDDGVNDGRYTGCMPGCTMRGPYCGDGVRDRPQEECDNGVNLSQYGGCAPGCVRGPYCGDGIVQSGYEQCDDGHNTGGYGECGSGCVIEERCGDGKLQEAFGEECDDGNRTTGDGCNANCRLESVY